MRRFCIKHWYRFAKQRLYWTLPRLQTPEQHERWSDLLGLMTWQVSMAREAMVECALPWQKQQPVEARTPGPGLSGYGRRYGRDGHTGLRSQSSG